MSNNHEEHISDIDRQIAERDLGAHRAFGAALPGIRPKEEQWTERQPAPKLTEAERKQARLQDAGTIYAALKSSERFNRNVRRLALGVGAAGLTLLALDKLDHVETPVPTATEIAVPIAGAYLGRSARQEAEHYSRLANHELQMGMLITSPKYAADYGYDSNSVQPVPEWMLVAMNDEQRESVASEIAEYGNDAQKAQLPLTNPHAKQ